MSRIKAIKMPLIIAVSLASLLGIADTFFSDYVVDVYSWSIQIIGLDYSVSFSENSIRSLDKAIDFYHPSRHPHRLFGILCGGL